MIKKNLLNFFIFLMLVSIVACDKRCSIDVHRFEQDFFNINPDSFDVEFVDLINKYPDFLSDPSIDFKNDFFLNDTVRLIFDSVQVVFGEELPMMDELERGFCNYKKYFPSETFSIYTFSDRSFDYRTPVVFANEKLFISLQLFLGSNHSFYKSFVNFPEYISFSHDVQYLPSTCYVTLAGRHIPYHQQAEIDNFLASILHSAKAYFFAQKMLPNVPEHYLFKCEEDKIKWCQDNERMIWEYMIENEYLFSSSSNLIERFVALAPFSKFGLDIDTQSPGGVGVWLGLQILNEYADNNNVSLVDVLNETDYMKILNKSEYKP